MASDKSTKSLVDRAYEEIRAMILDLRLLPGQMILIDELALQLGMSRTPVREAIIRLSTSLEGLLEVVPRKGVVVTIPTVESMREIYEIIQGLEGQAIFLAVDRIDEAALQALEEAVLAQEAALAGDDLDRWVQFDRRFHHLLIDAAKNQRLQELVLAFDGQLHRTRVATIRLRSREQLLESTQEHRAILEALQARDRARLQQVHTRHRERALVDLAQVIANYGAELISQIAARSRASLRRLN